MNDTADGSAVVSRILRAELLAILAVSGIGLVYGVETAYSAFLGGVTSLVPNLYFARRVFGRPCDGAPVTIAGRMFRAEFTKLALVALMFASIFAFIEAMNVVALLLGYMIVRTTGVVVSVRVG